MEPYVLCQHILHSHKIEFMSGEYLKESSCNTQIWLLQPEAAEAKVYTGSYIFHISTALLFLS